MGDKANLTDELVLKKIKLRQSYIEVDENYFVELLRHSLSLDLNHKERVIDAFPGLYQKQFDDLIQTFENERVQFKEVADKYPEKIVDLVDKRALEWEALGEKIRDREIEENKKSEEENKINDIKSQLGL